jgi:hypothetical protein
MLFLDDLAVVLDFLDDLAVVLDFNLLSLPYVVTVIYCSIFAFNQ